MHGMAPDTVIEEYRGERCYLKQAETEKSLLSEASIKKLNKGA